MKSRKLEEVAPDWAGIAAAREREVADLRGELESVRRSHRGVLDSFGRLDDSIDRVKAVLDEIEPQCHRRDVRGAEVVDLVRKALGGCDE